MSAFILRSGTQLVAYRDHRPAERLFITVTRAAKDGSWVDIACHTWAVRWTKRMAPDKLRAVAELCAWSEASFEEQMADHEAKMQEKL